MVDDYEYEAGTLNEIWDELQLKEDELTGRLVVQDEQTKQEYHSFGKDSKINGVVHVTQAGDLPDAENGVRTLESGTAYFFTDFVTDPASLELTGISPLFAPHGGVGGYIHTGGSDLFIGSGPLFFRDMYFHAPGGTIFNVSADDTTETLVESISFADFAGLGNIANLGAIDGYRVPTFKGVNFEDFDAGLTFTGTSEKVFFSSCPMRGVTSSDVTILEFDADTNTGIVDMTNNYIKEVQPDTVVVDVDPTASIGEIFQYRGTTHDATVDRDNILTGEAGTGVQGYRVRDSYPLEDSKVIGQYSLDAATTVPITSAATSKTDESAYVKVGGSTTAYALERMTHTSPNEVTYNGERSRLGDLMASLEAGNGDRIAAAFFLNGSLVSGTPTAIQTDATAGGIDKSLFVLGVIPTLNDGDTVEVRVANLDSTTDVEIGEMNVKVTE